MIIEITKAKILFVLITNIFQKSRLHIIILINYKDFVRINCNKIYQLNIYKTKKDATYITS